MIEKIETKRIKPENKKWLWIQHNSGLRHNIRGYHIQWDDYAVLGYQTQTDKL